MHVSEQQLRRRTIRISFLEPLGEFLAGIKLPCFESTPTGGNQPIYESLPFTNTRRRRRMLGNFLLPLQCFVLAAIALGKIAQNGKHARIIRKALSRPHLAQ